MAGLTGVIRRSSRAFIEGGSSSGVPKNSRSELSNVRSIVSPESHLAVRSRLVVSGNAAGVGWDSVASCSIGFFESWVVVHWRRGGSISSGITGDPCLGWCELCPVDLDGGNPPGMCWRPSWPWRLRTAASFVCWHCKRHRRHKPNSKTTNREECTTGQRCHGRWSWARVAQ